MKRLDVKNFLEVYTEVPIFPLDFPMQLDTCMVFDFSGTTNRGDGLSESQLIVYSRSESIDSAEGDLLTLSKRLNNMTNVDIGETNVVLIEALGKHVDYGGEDENGRYYFIKRFKLLVDS